MSRRWSRLTLRTRLSVLAAGAVAVAVVAVAGLAWLVVRAELYQQLVLKEQKVDVLAADFGHQADPELFTIYARVKDPAQVNYVRDQILKTFERYKTELIDQAKLDATRSRMRYGFAMAMNSNDRIADALAPYIALERTPETLNRLFDTYQTVTAADIRDAVKKYFREESRTVVTLATKGQNLAALGRGQGEGQD